jgi:hypothetical protein
LPERHIRIRDMRSRVVDADLFVHCVQRRWRDCADAHWKVQALAESKRLPRSYLTDRNDRLVRVCAEQRPYRHAVSSSDARRRITALH